MKEKKLTPAEIKKRDEIAKAMKKDDPDMPMDKKMAIATATAKRVAEGKMKQAMMRRQDMAKLAGLYSKAMKAMPGSPKQKAISKQIDQYRKELGLDESVESLEEATDLYNKGGIQIVRFSAGKGKVGVEITVKKGNSPSEIGGQIVLSDAQFKNLQRVLPKMNLRKGLGESLDEGLKDGYIIYKKIGSGINKIKSLGSLKRMPKGKELDKVMDKYPEADGIMAMSKALRNKVQVEAVSPAQQAAIAISKKERGEKPKLTEKPADFIRLTFNSPSDVKKAKKWMDNNLPGNNQGFTSMDASGKDIEFEDVDDAEGLMKKLKRAGFRFKLDHRESVEECADEKDFKPHMMYDPKTGKGVKANTYADHVKLDKMGYVHDKPEVKESRAYRDAMRGMSARGATKGMARTKKDRDIEATDDDRKAASKNIIMQLRKAADLPTGANVEFDRGKGKVTRDQAKATLARFNALSKPNEKEKFQKSIKSLADIKKILGR